MQGTCLCGAVSVSVSDQSSVSACHCGMCRRWGGGPALVVPCGTGVLIANEDAVTVFRSSEWAERGFCSNCGTHLFYRVLGSGEYFIPAGLLGDDVSLEFTEQIFIDKKPAYYDFANSTEDMTEAEVFAKFGAGT